jgi:formylmethanofuran dehydrogenase subunit E
MTPLPFSRVLGAFLFCLIGGCTGAAPPPPPMAAAHGHPHAAHPPGAASADEGLSEVARIHGAAGPWAVAGYRMGKFALQKLGIGRQSFDLEVVHHSPREVQYSCIADGASAATGASLGKLNLSFAEADKEHVETTYRRKSTGAAVTLRPAKAFVERFRDVPMEQIPAAGRAVMELSDAEIFEEVTAAR